MLKLHEYGPRIRTIRQNKKISMARLARESGYGLNTLREIESGKKGGRQDFREQAINDIMTTLGVSLDDLLKTKPHDHKSKSGRGVQVWAFVPPRIKAALKLSASIDGISISAYIAIVLREHEEKRHDEFTS